MSKKSSAHTLSKKKSNPEIKKYYVVPTVDMIVLPGAIYPLLVGRTFSINAVNAAHQHEKSELLLVSEPNKNKINGIEDLLNSLLQQEVGIVATIEHLTNLPSGLYKVVVRGNHRVRITDYDYAENEVITAQTLPFPVDNDISINQEKAYLASIKQLFEQYLNTLDSSTQVDYRINQPKFAPFHENPYFLYQTANILPLLLDSKLELLKKNRLSEQYEILIHFLSNQIEISEIKKGIYQKLEKGLEKNQKRYYVQEQLRILQEEFGDEAANPEFLKLKNKIEEANMPPKVLQKCQDELEKLRRIPPMSPEYGVIVNYLELLTQLPWTNASSDNLELSHARKVLDAHHYGLEKVKDRILEYIAVLNHSGNPRGQILCFVGPPGVGKTSLGKSIAGCLNKKYVRIALGGIADEAEIRGHRRTYIGSMPGRIINAMKRAGTINPLIVLDEIDKLGKDYKGDPSAALLEVLDLEQNHTFNDHFVEVDYDLSRVFFVATANVESDIPLALRDRMEIIQLEGYTENEKLHIAKQFLVPKQCEENGIQESEVIFEDAAIVKIINEYTSEAGVRNLEQKISSILRKIVRKKVENKEKHKRKQQISIKAKDIKQYLGIARAKDIKKWNEDKIGVVYGLAWTSVGGRILPIECVLCEGGSKIQLTGRMGNVMKESVQTAYTFLKSNAQQWNIPSELFKDKEIHIHLPEGAIPKDGPSAGISLFTVLYSVFTQKPVRYDVALTGEITLTGKVLPIGGLTEKLLAAKRNHIYTVVIPAENEDTIKEINPEIIENMTIHYVKHATEVINLLFR